MASNLDNRIPRRNFTKPAVPIAGLADPAASAPPVKWAAEQVRLAVTANGSSLQVVNSPELSGKPALPAAASDPAGFVYGLPELADSIGLRPDGSVAAARLHYRRVNQAERCYHFELRRGAGLEGGAS